MRLLAVTVLLASVLPAQSGRYELGRRLRVFEQAWEKVDEAARARAVPHIERAVRAFLGLNVPVAGRSIEDARRALLGDAAAPPADAWADAIVLAPSPRLVDPEVGALTVTASSLFEADDDPPPGVRVRCELLGPYDKVLVAPVEGSLVDVQAGLTLTIRGVAAGDHTLLGTILVGDRAVRTARVGVTLAPGVAARVSMVDVVAGNLAADAIDADTTTLRYLLDLLHAALAGKVAETDLPYTALLLEAENIGRLRLRGGAFLTSGPLGEHWLCVAAEKRRIPVRLFAPPRRTPDQKLPLVVALHGAGGSENMFFDAYGAGKLVTEAYQRDWIVIAPRSAGGALPTVIDEVARLYPIDRRKIFLIGHSMGAMAAIEASTEPIARYAGVVALGGGGRVPAGARLPGRRFFVGIGARDFAHRGALALRDALTQADAEVRFEEYAATEHLTVVQRALPDVFAWLDTIADPKKKQK